MGRPQIRANPENQFGHGMTLVSDEYVSDSQDEHPGFVEVECEVDETYVPQPPSTMSLLQDSLLRNFEPTVPFSSPDLMW